MINSKIQDPLGKNSNLKLIIIEHMKVLMFEKLGPSGV